MSRGKYQRRRKKSPIWYNLLLTVFVLIFVGSIAYLGNYYIGSRKQAAEYDDLAALVEAARGTTPAAPEVPQVSEADPENPTGATAPQGGAAAEEALVDENGILLEYASLYEMNSDMAGWISIEGTKINYPVMHTPGRPDYYLHRSFKDEYNYWGCIYAREECDLETPSDNVTLYGHYMKDGSMFAGLHAYQERSFWEEHRYIRFDTLTEHHTYEIFAVFLTTASEGEGFAYHDFINAADEESFDTFIAKCMSLSLYGTDLMPKYGDKIICLSTCEYTQTNGRLVVAAVRIN